MADKLAPSYFSRILLVAVIFLCIGAGLYVGSTMLEPVPLPEPPPPKTAVKFDPRVDVSKNQVFAMLRIPYPPKVEPGELGRINPFASISRDVSATSTTSTLSVIPSAEPVPTLETPTTTVMEPIPVTTSTELFPI